MLESRIFFATIEYSNNPSADVVGADHVLQSRADRPALVSGDWSHYWVYVVGPIAGAFVPVACRGPPPAEYV